MRKLTIKELIYYIVEAVLFVILFIINYDLVLKIFDKVLTFNDYLFLALIALIDIITLIIFYLQFKNTLHYYGKNIKNRK